MIERLLKRWPLRLFLKKISWLMVAMTGVLLVVLTGLSVYGNSVGDLVVSIDDLTVRSLALSETGEFGASDSRTFLAAEGVKDIRDATYYYIPEDIAEGDGLKSDKKTNMYFAYSFYLKNMSNVSIGYSSILKIDQQTKGIDKAIRIMIIVDDQEPMIFARPKDDGTAEVLESNESIVKKAYTTIPFTENEIEIAHQPVTEVGLVQKYTIVMWLEGWDSDCTDDIIGGKLEASLTFRILEAS